MTKTFYREVKDSNGVVLRSESRIWEVQKPPYIRPLDFTYQLSRTLKGYGQNPGALGSSAPCYNSAYAKLVSEISDSSQWANNLHEADKSLSSAVTRITQISRFANHLRRGDFRSASVVLGEVRKPPGVSLKKSFADNFLEWHFGWSPLLEDIGSMAKVLTKTDFGTRKVTSHAMDFIPMHTRDSSGSNTSVVDAWTRYRVKLGCSVRVTNPNAYLANQIGFANPLSVAWEAVPYSFVVDWFVNVGQFLSSLTDFVGLQITGSYTTVSDERYQRYYFFNSFDNSVTDNIGTYFEVRRRGGISGPVLVVKPFRGFSLTRGVTALSLLVQKLR